MSEPPFEFGNIDLRFFGLPELVGAEDEGTLAGEIGRDGCGVGCVDEVDKWRDFSFFFRTLRSVPEASDKLGLPGRLREVEDDDLVILPSRSESMPPCFSLRPEGVLVPDDGTLDLSPSAASLAIFARRSFSIRSRSSSESVCGRVCQYQAYEIWEQTYRVGI